MIPILYPAGETEFTNDGIGALRDTISCKVTEERNSTYELELTYMIDGVHFEELVPSNIIMAIPADGKAAQPFRIYDVSKAINGKATVYAEHISYQLSLIPVKPFTVTGAVAALEGLVMNSLEENPFEVWTDITNDFTTYSQSVPNSFRQLLGGIDGSILDCFGGEYEFDRWTVKLHANRGSNNGVVIEYGKNLLDLEQEENISNVVTGIVPYWQSNQEGDDTVVMLPEYVINSEYADNYPFKRTIVKDFSEDFDSIPTEDQLRSKAQSYIVNNAVGVPDVSFDVEFLALSDTEEYKNLAAERVNLCDTVTVRFVNLGVDAEAKITKTVYDVLAERYDSITLGSYKTSLVDTLQKIESSMVTEKEAQSRIDSALDHAKQLISGGLGGHVVITYINGYPSEITIGDTDNIETMQNCIRINMNGIAFSQNGYNGDYSTAWTIDSQFVADFITTGTLRAGLIKSGMLKSDANDDVWWDLDSGELHIGELLEIVTTLTENTTNITSLMNRIKMSSEGIAIYSSDDSDSYILIQNDGLHVYVNGENVANYLSDRAEVDNMFFSEGRVGKHIVDLFTQSSVEGTGFFYDEG